MPCDHLKWPQWKNIFEKNIDFRFSRFFSEKKISDEKKNIIEKKIWIEKKFENFIFSLKLFFVEKVSFHHLIVATNRLTPFLWP